MTDLTSSNSSPKSSLRTAGLHLVVASFAVLALELILIRWIPVQARVIAYFPNLILISAFLGLGLGCLIRRRVALWLWCPILLVVAATAAAMSRVAFTHGPTNDYLWLLYYDLPKDAPVVQGIRLPIVAIFCLSAAIFVPLGSFIADRLRLFKAAGRPLTGYACDLGGSLAGVVAMTLLFFTGSRPWVWITVVVAAGLVLFTRSRRAAMLHIVAGIVVIVLLQVSDHADIYSPYYALNFRAEGGHVVVLANGALHQDAVPLRMATPLQHPYARLTREGYHLPYRLLKRKPRNVLVLGAGTGNDVSVALDEGAERVDAVEIDPEILRLGRLHPDHPYSSPRVRKFNTDARAFLNYSSDKYDLIVFGTLDSVTRLSALSNVRLENFVYTVECMRTARRHLTPDGGLVLYSRVAAPYVQDHMAALLVTAFGERPNVIEQDYRLFNRIFLAGSAFHYMSDPSSETARAAAALIDVPTDDWPFLYLRERGISGFYLSLIALLLAISLVAVLAASAEMRASILTGRFDAEMFLFGLAFLLIETKLVTEMNLVWGATWLTSAVVFGSILLMVLVGTLWMQRRPLPWTVAASGLVVSLLLTWLVPVQWIVGTPLPLRLVASTLFIGLPILFASACFAVLFRERERPDEAFGWNMLGAVVGGLLEFTSMAVGFRATTLIALLAYLVAVLLRYRRVRGKLSPLLDDVNVASP